MSVRRPIGPLTPGGGGRRPIGPLTPVEPSAPVPAAAPGPGSARPPAGGLRLGGASLPVPKPTLYEWPFIFVLGYLFVDYGRPHNWVPALGLIRPGVIVLGGGILSLMSRRVLPASHVLAKYMLWFCALMAMMVPFAVNSRMAFNGTRDFTLFLFGACFPIIAFVDTYERLLKALKFWVYLHVPLGIYSITHRGIGVGSFLTDENDFALAINVILPYAFAMAFLARKTVSKLVLFGVVLLLVASSTATLSRGGFIGLVCVFGLLWLKSPKKLVSAALVGILCLAMLVVTPASYWKEMKTIETAQDEGDTGYERLYLWGIAWKMWLDHPIFGVGPNNYPYNNSNYENPERVARGRHVWGMASHSLYFTVLPELGLVGTCLFFAMIVTSWIERRRIARRCRDALAADDLPDDQRERVKTVLQLCGAMDASLLTFLVTGAFIAVLYYPHIWLLMAFTAALDRVSRRVLPEPEKATAVAGFRPLVASPALAGRPAR
jgi:probable O-glycosylation ligase (exosortase A-associated)